VAARPVVDLTRGHAGEAAEAGLTDAGTGQKGGEFRMEERRMRSYYGTQFHPGSLRGCRGGAIGAIIPLSRPLKFCLEVGPPRNWGEHQDLWGRGDPRVNWPKPVWRDRDWHHMPGSPGSRGAGADRCDRRPMLDADSQRRGHGRGFNQGLKRPLRLPNRLIRMRHPMVQIAIIKRAPFDR
jgi:hypothetical protein